MFAMTTSPFELIARIVIVYAFLFVLMRLIGKRHVGEFSPFDLIVLLMLSESVQNAMVGEEKSVTGGLIGAATLYAISQAIGYLSWRNRRAERFLEGVPRILVRHGVVDEKAMADEQITRSELLEALRKEGHTSLLSVRYAILENDGVIAVGARKTNAQD